MAGAGLRRVAWRRFRNLPVFSEPWLLSVDLESTSQDSSSPLYSHSPEQGSADIPYPCPTLSWVTLLPFSTRPSQSVSGVSGDDVLGHFLPPMHIYLEKKPFPEAGM